MLTTTRRSTLAAALACLALLGTAVSANAAPPDSTPSLRKGLERARQLLIGIKHGTVDRQSLRVSAPQSAVAEAAAIPSKNQGNLTGTWSVAVPGEEEIAFYAYQTFGVDGTFVETSSLLGTLTEGPAHGVWRNGANGVAYLTFELFIFDAGAAVGRVRVRCEITVDGDTFAADSAVDILDLDGTVIAEEVAVGPFYGTRLRALPL